MFVQKKIEQIKYMVKFEKSMPYSIVKIPEFCYNSITKYYAKE